MIIALSEGIKVEYIGIVDIVERRWKYNLSNWNAW
jgi:hypothetical protein